MHSDSRMNDSTEPAIFSVWVARFFSLNQNIYKSIGEVLTRYCYSRLVRLKSMQLGCLYDTMLLKIHILNLVVTTGIQMNVFCVCVCVYVLLGILYFWCFLIYLFTLVTLCSSEPSAVGVLKGAALHLWIELHCALPGVQSACEAHRGSLCQSPQLIKLRYICAWRRGAWWHHAARSAALLLAAHRPGIMTVGCRFNDRSITM